MGDVVIELGSRFPVEISVEVREVMRQYTAIIDRVAAVTVVSKTTAVATVL